MKNTLKYLLPVLFLISLLGTPLRAQTSPGKIATIDLQKVCDKYYKWQRAKDVLAKETAELQKAHDDMVDNLKREQDEYKQLRALIDDPMITAADRKAREQRAQSKLDVIQTDTQSIRDLDNQGQQKLALDDQRLTETLLQDIQTAIKAKARTAGFALVLNSSSEALHPGASVLYSNGENDITDEIIKQLNAVVSDATAKPATNAPDKKK